MLQQGGAAFPLSGYGRRVSPPLKSNIPETCHPWLFIHSCGWRVLGSGENQSTTWLSILPLALFASSSFLPASIPNRLDPGFLFCGIFGSGGGSIVVACGRRLDAVLVGSKCLLLWLLLLTCGWRLWLLTCGIWVFCLGSGGALCLCHLLLATAQLFFVGPATSFDSSNWIRQQSSLVVLLTSSQIRPLSVGQLVGKLASTTVAIRAAACTRACLTVALEMQRSCLLETRQLWNWWIGSTTPQSRSVFNAAMMFPRPLMDHLNGFHGGVFSTVGGCIDLSNDGCGFAMEQKWGMYIGVPGEDCTRGLCNDPLVCGGCRMPPSYIPYKGTYVPYDGTFGTPDQGQMLNMWESQTAELALRNDWPWIVPRYTLEVVLEVTLEHMCTGLRPWHL